MFGLASERLDAGIAIAGFYTARANGSKVKFKDMFPDFKPRTGMTTEEFNTTLASNPGVRSKTLPLPKKKAK